MSCRRLFSVFMVFVLLCGSTPMPVMADTFAGSDGVVSQGDTDVYADGQTIVPQNNGEGVSVKGRITSNNPAVCCTVQLIQGGQVNCSVMSTPNAGSASQDFVISGVGRGTYDLVITKLGHLEYVITGLVVRDSAIDLSAHSNELISNITLIAGDINGDDCVDLRDVVTLTSSNIYSQQYDTVENKSADVNGDKCFDLRDLVIITSAENYGKSAVEVEFEEMEDALTYYTIVWKNDDGTVLKTTQCREGEVPLFGDDTPTKTSDSQYDYTFEGWSPELKAATEDTTYTAVYARQEKSYDVTLTQNMAEAGSVSGGGSYAYGSSVTVQVTTNVGYTFLGWYENDSLITSDAEYTFTVSANRALTAMWTYAGLDDFYYKLTETGYTITGVKDKTKTEYIIPDCVTSIGNCAFYNCSSLASVTIPDGATSIGDSAFDGCSSLTSVTIPDSVTSIGSDAFFDCSSLTSVMIPDSVTSIGDTAFAYCSSLTSVTIPDSVTSIGYRVFTYCSSLTSVTIPDSVTSIGDTAFEGCSSLTSVTIPDSVTSVGNGAFWSCRSLMSVTMGDSVTSIGEDVFKACDSLTSITIPDSVTSIGNEAFRGCYSLKSIFYGGTASQWAAISKGTNWDYNTGSYTITYGVTEDTPTYYTIVWKNDDGTVLKTTQCKEGEMPLFGDDTPTKSGDAQHEYAFAGWSPELKAATEDTTYTAVYARQEKSCNVTLTQNIADAGTVSGGGSYAYGSSVTVRATTNTGYTFLGWYENESLLTSNAEYTFTVSANRALTAIWKLRDEYTGLDDFYYKLTETGYTITGVKDKTKTEYIIPNCVTSIGDYAFHGCSSLMSVTIPASVTNIGASAFSGCTSLTGIAYGGTASQWEAISKGANWDDYTGSYTVTYGATEYTIIWKNDDGTVLKTTQCRKGEVPFFGETLPTKPGDAQYDYAFAGWSPELKAAAEDMIYTAVYTKVGRDSYTITYNANGGTGAPSPQTKANGTTVTLSSVIPEYEGYVFWGWLCVSDGITYAAGASFSLDADADLYALWEHTCEKCNGSGEVVSRFGCSSCSGRGKITETGWVSEICSTCKGDKETWTICTSCHGIGKHYLYLCSCGGSWWSDMWSNSYCPGCLLTGTQKTIINTKNCINCTGGKIHKTCTTCNGEGYNWKKVTTTSRCSSCDGTGSIERNNTCSVCDGGKTIVEYGTYNITLMDGNSTIETVSVSVNNSYTLTVPTKSGYVFMGWYDAVENGKQYTDASGTSLSVWLDFSDKTLYAQWKMNCAVSLTQNIAEAGSVSGGGNYYYGDSVTVRAITNTGYTFLGWYEGNSLVSASENYTVIMSARSRSLEARWKISNYTVSAEKNIEEAGTVSGGGNYDHGTTVTVEATTNTGYIFLGWYENDSLITSDVNYTFDALSDRTLIAMWRMRTGATELEDFTYTLTEDGYKITGVKNEETTDYIIIPDGVTSIGDYAFYKCSNLTSVAIGNGVTSIGEVAFKGCTNLTSVTIGDGVTSIGDYAFEDCSSLTSVTIGDGVTSIGERAFNNCSSLTSVTIGNSVTSIGASAFSYCSGLTSVTIPDSVTSIGDCAFYDCGSLTSVTIGAGVTSIGKEAFEDCSSLTSVTIGAGVTSIGASAFSYCSGLTSVTIPDSVTSIGDCAFYDCGSLTSVTIGAGVTSIGKEAFEDCSSLTSVTIGAGVTSIGKEAFEDCSSLTSVYITDIEKWCGISFGDSTSNPLYYAQNLYLDNELVTDIIIPNGVTSIGDYAFYNCSSLTNVTIPDSVTNIGDYAFQYCSKLTSVTIPDSVTSIGRYAFYNCTSLTSVTIPDGVTSIGECAFEGCSSLTSVTIPDSVTSIDSYAFFDCSSLTSVTIPDSVTSIGRYAFYNCTSLTSVTIPDGVTSIETATFQYCRSLPSIVIPDSVTSIGDYAFNCCTSLPSIVIPDSVTSIGDYAFQDCNKLTSVTIPNSITSIGDYVFSGCSSLTSVTIPNSITSIGESAFGGCGSLTSVTIPDGVTSIGREAFEGCPNLTSVTIPDSVTSIGERAFFHCTKLASIRYRGTASQWSAISKGSYWAHDYAYGKYVSLNYTITYNYKG